MTTKKTERVPKLKERIPEETRQHSKMAREEMRQAIENLLPEGFIEHRHAARKEMLLAVRSLLDSVIQRMDKKV